MRVGLIVNPIAGLGGPAGLKGSDVPDIRRRTAGQPARCPERAATALGAMASLRDRVRLLAGAGEMGLASAAAAGWPCEAVGPRADGPTTAADTRALAAALAARGVALLLVCGGDGTLADVCDVAGERVPILGIPAGVKMQSGGFALSPPAAGRAAAAFLADPARPTVRAEVMDLDEEAYRAGVVAPRLHGVIRAPAAAALLQSPKQRAPAVDAQAVAGLAAELGPALASDVPHAIGPGSTTAALLERLGLESTLLGVDVVRGGRVVARDVDRAALERAIGGDPARVVVAPIGGQGFLLGRGNQQLSPRVLRAAGPDGLVVVATEKKLADLSGRPLLVDTGDAALDRTLAGAGWIRVLLAPGRAAAYPIAPAG